MSFKNFKTIKGGLHMDGNKITHKNNIMPRPNKSGLIHDTSRFIKIRLCIIGMLVILFASASVIIIYTNSVNETKVAQENTVNSFKEEQFEHIWSVLTNHILVDAKSNIAGPADTIESQIQSMDLTDLKPQLDTGVYPECLLSVFKNNLKKVQLNGIDNGRNSAIAISNDFVLVNYGYHMYPTDASSGKFSDIVSKGYNTSLGTTALDKLYKQDESNICVEMTSSLVKNHHMISDTTKEDFKTVYMNEGIEGLRNYQFLVPIYITETGDVFGQDDIVDGNRIDYNHKFVIIQEFNLYDQLLKGYPECFDDSNLSAIEQYNQSVIQSLYSLGLIFVTFVVLIMFYCISIYNNFIYGYLLALKKND